MATVQAMSAEPRRMADIATVPTSGFYRFTSKDLPVRPVGSGSERDD